MDDKIDNSTLDVNSFYETLGEEEKIAYAHSIFGKLLDLYTHPFSSFIIDEDIPECFYEYFKTRGFELVRIENNDKKEMFCIKVTDTKFDIKVRYSTQLKLMKAILKRENMLSSTPCKLLTKDDL